MDSSSPRHYSSQGRELSARGVASTSAIDANTNVTATNQPSRIRGFAMPSYPGHPSVPGSSSQHERSDDYEGGALHRYQGHEDPGAAPSLRPRKRGRGGAGIRDLGEGRNYMPNTNVDTYIPDYDREGDTNVGSARHEAGFGKRRRLSPVSPPLPAPPSRRRQPSPAELRLSPVERAAHEMQNLMTGRSMEERKAMLEVCMASVGPGDVWEATGKILGRFWS